MPNFSLGFLSIAFAIGLPILWLLQHQLRRLGAWSKRTDAPKDRVGFFVMVMAILGFVAGSFAQPLWDKAASCKASGQPLGACLFVPDKA